jgi:uncharacterized protein with HEPN domain
LSSDDRDLLEDIVVSARPAIAYVHGFDEAAFHADRKTQDAVMYRLGVIGEAAGHLSDEARASIALDWKAMRGMRHHLFHGYRDVKVPTVFATVRDDLPRVLQAIEQALP